jgi:RHS repeat-associated protein
MHRLVRSRSWGTPVHRALAPALIYLLTCLLHVPALGVGNARADWNGYPTPEAHCFASWQYWMTNNPASRYIGALESDNWTHRGCQWTRFQYLCPAETGLGMSACGTLNPAGTTFTCPLIGWTRMFPGICVRNADRPPPQRPPYCYNHGGASNATPGNPVILSTGTKIDSVTDFVSADGRFRIGRNYRSSPFGYTTSIRAAPLGLGNGWQFNFEAELHLGTFSGSPSSPTGNVTLLAPDGSAYDFVMDSSAQFVPRAASGSVSYDYRLEFVGTLPPSLATIYNSSTQWKVTGPDDRVWTFTTFSKVNWSTPKYYVGRPTTIAERDGYSWTLNYNADASLAAIVDTFGRTASFTWNYFYVTFLSGVAGSLPEPEAVATVTFPDGTSVKYDYDPPATTTPPSTTRIDKLTGVTLRDVTLAVANSTTYHYEDPNFSFALTGITDHRGVRIATYEYDSSGRVVFEEGADDQQQMTIEYGTSGSLLTRTVTNALGRRSVYKFQKYGSVASDIRLVGVDGEVSAHCPATATSVAYGSNGFVSQTTDEEGRVTTYTRDAIGRPTEITLASGLPEQRDIAITWNATYNVPDVIEQPGLTSTRVYNGSGQLDSLTETDTTTHTVPYSTNGQTRGWAYTYATGGLVETIDGPLPGTGDTVSYTYDAAGYVATYTDELGHVTTVNTVNGRGQPTETEDANGLITTLAYDAVGRLITTTVDPAGVTAETAIEYDETGNVTKVTRPDGSFLEMEYDDNSRVTVIANALGDNIHFTYDAMGNVTSREAYNGWPQLFFKWEKAFDELGRVIELTGAGPASWAYGYDKVGNLTSVTDPNVRAASMAYDGLNRLIAFTDERSAVTSTTYGDTDEPASVTDPNIVVTGYVRNGWGEAIQEQSNDVGTIVYERNQKGQVTERTDARSVEADFTYDDGGRITATTYPAESASDVTYAYDSTAGGNYGVGRLTGVTDAAGTAAYSYDLLGRTVLETRVIGVQSYNTGYAYNAAGKVIEMTYPSGRTVYYDRDVDGQIQIVRHQASGGPVEWLVYWVGRTPFGPRSGINFANNVYDWRAYDQDSRITILETEVGSGTSSDLIHWTYAYSDKRNLTGIADVLNPAKSQFYMYADNGFLESAVGPWGTPVAASTSLYSLVSGSNRLSGVTTDGTPSRQFDSDAAGNVIEDTDLSTSTTRELVYNNPGQVVTFEIGGVAQGIYKYDYLSLLASRGLPGSPTTLHYVHDLSGNVIAEYDSAGTLLREYVWLDNRPIAAIEAGTTPVVYWVHTDHLERPVMMTDDNANVVWQAKYLPYGEVYSVTGPASLDYRFPGQWFQLESGLNYNWHRHYDPTTGRYVQPDPIGMPDGPSRWAYAQNSPLMNVDPTGEIFIPSWVYKWLFWPQPRKAPNYCEIGPNPGGFDQLFGPGALQNEQADGGGDNGDPIDGLRKKGQPDTKTNQGTRQTNMPGGEQGRQEDFDSLPGSAEDKGEGVKVKTLSDGRKVISRPRDRRGPNTGGTIEVQSPGGRPWDKFRY